MRMKPGRWYTVISQDGPGNLRVSVAGTGEGVQAQLFFLQPHKTGLSRLTGSPIGVLPLLSWVTLGNFLDLSELPFP